MRILVAIVVLGVGASARADYDLKNPSILDRLEDALWYGRQEGHKIGPPHFAFDRTIAIVDPTAAELGDRPEASVPAPFVVNAIDGKSSWAISDVAVPIPSEPGKPRTDKGNDGHVTALFDAPWPAGPLFIHIGELGPGVADPKTKPEVLPRKIDPAAADAVKRFEATLGDPKAFAATVSDRKDAFMFGSDARERYQGGDKVRATLAKWQLAFKLRDGIVAGATASKTVAWLAANVDARPAAKPKAAATPYRVTAIYELHGKSWDIVELQFSVLPP
jgi:hypothetical protein